MREIKFRAWDLDYEWMIDHFFVQSNGIAHATPDQAFDTPNIEIEENPNLLIMQFTGLTDKNGVDIYEGDILKDHIGKGVVEYKERYAAFRLKYGKPNTGRGKWFLDYNLRGERESLEVIGNIHQNHELTGE